MLTSRGWWLLLFVISLLAMGAIIALRGAATLLLLGLTLLTWMAFEWAKFVFQARIALKNLVLSRQLRDDRGPVRTLWAGESYAVKCNIRLGGRWGLSLGDVVDRAPTGATRADGSWGGPLPSRAGTVVAWSGRIHCEFPGEVRFEGVRVRLSDLQGFFLFETFLRDPQTYPVLPKLVDAEAKQRGSKRFNLLPPPGVHRLRRPGSGSELLDLRDYRPGDPPKQIAWKASARRGKLMTREFESEVPLRSTLLLNLSDSVRLGPPGANALTQLVDISATVSQAALANRDLVGLVICDGPTIHATAPARTPAHAIGLLRKLSETACRQASTGAAKVDPLVERAYPFVADVYPDLLDRSVNRFPFWLPLLFPRPAWVDGQRSSQATLWTWCRRIALLAFAVVAALAAIVPESVSPIWVWSIGGGIAVGYGFVLGSRLLAFRARRLAAWRKRLAQVIATVEEAPLGAPGEWLEDDAAFSQAIQRFLSAHGVTYDVPIFGDAGQPLFAGADNTLALARSLSRAVGRARDNEQFVILADLLTGSVSFAPLLAAVKSAKARHHQVIVISPTPEGADLEQEGDSVLPPSGLDAEGIVKHVRSTQLRKSWRKLRREFGKLGVPLLSARAGDPAQFVLHRLEQMRTIQGASRG